MCSIEEEAIHRNLRRFVRLAASALRLGKGKGAARIFVHHRTGKKRGLFPVLFFDCSAAKKRSRRPATAAQKWVGYWKASDVQSNRFVRFHASNGVEHIIFGDLNNNLDLYACTYPKIDKKRDC